MKKVFLWLIIVSMIVVFSLASCKTGITKEEAVEESVAEEKEEKITENVAEEETAILWTIGVSPNCVISEDKIFSFSFDGSTAFAQAFDVHNGRELWQWKDEWEMGGHIIGSDLEILYVNRKDNRLYALSADNGEMLWRMIPDPEKEMYWWRLIPFKHEEIVYIGGFEYYENYSVRAINKEDGSILWSLDGIGEVGPYLSETGQTLLVGNQALDPMTGQFKYETRLFLNWRDTPAANNMLIHLTTSGIVMPTGPLVAFNMDSGQTVWQTDRQNIREILEITPSFIYVDAPRGSITEYVDDLVCFDLMTGEELWGIQELAGGFLGEVEEAAIISDKKRGFTYAVDSKSGNTIWENDDLILTHLWGLCGNILVGYDRTGLGYNTSGYLFGIDFKTGDRVWRIEENLPLWPEFVIQNEKIVYIDDSYQLVVIDPKTGTQIQSISISESVELYQRGELLLLGGSTTVLAVRI